MRYQKCGVDTIRYLDQQSILDVYVLISRSVDTRLRHKTRHQAHRAATADLTAWHGTTSLKTVLELAALIIVVAQPGFCTPWLVLIELLIFFEFSVLSSIDLEKYWLTISIFQNQQSVLNIDISHVPTGPLSLKTTHWTGRPGILCS